jgi:hypothetical protein
MTSHMHCAFLDACNALVDLLLAWGDVPMLTANLGNFLDCLFGTEVHLLVASFLCC